jgi:hypothetical protein
VTGLEEAHGDSWLPSVVGAGDLVELPHAPGAVERVGLGAGLLVGGGGEHPAQMLVALLGPLEDGLHGLHGSVQRITGSWNQSTAERTPDPACRLAMARARLGLPTYRDADGVVEALELEEGEAPGRPGARVRDVEVVPPRHGGEPPVPGNGAPEGGWRPVEGARVGDLVQRRPRSHLTRAHEENRARVNQESMTAVAQLARRPQKKIKPPRPGYLDGDGGGTRRGGGRDGEGPGGEDAVPVGEQE